MKYILVLTAIGFLASCASTQKTEVNREPQQVIGEVDHSADYKGWAMNINQQYLADESVTRFASGINQYLNSKETKNLIKACNNESRMERVKTSSCTDLLNSCHGQSNLSAASYNSWYMAYERHVLNPIESEIELIKKSSISGEQKVKILKWLEAIKSDFHKKALILGNVGLPQDAKEVMTANSKIAFIQKQGKAEFMDNKLYAQGCIQSLKDDLEKNKRNYSSVTFSDK